MRHYTALIIEDDPDDTELLKLELSKLDFKIDCTDVDSEAGLRASLDEALPDIVISDYSMPGFTGLDALKIVREQKSDLPFILCSGFIGEEQAVDAVKNGVTDYCLKNNLGRLGISVERELKNYEWQRERQLDQQLVQATFNASGLSVAIIDKDGMFTKVNDQFAKLSGYTSEELIGMSYLCLNETESLEESEKVFNKILSEGQAHSNEWKLIRKDGNVCYVQSTITRIDNGESGNYIISYVQDVTEQKRLRAIRKHSEKTSNVGGWEMDLVLDRLYCNGVVLNIFDLPDGLELTADAIIEKLDEGSQKIFTDAIEQTAKDGLAFNKILRSAENNGAKKLIRVSGVPQTVNGRTVRVYGTFRDITEEEKKNEEIRKLSLVASKIHNGVIVFNEKVEIEWVNDSFLKATGYKLEDFTGTEFGDLLAGKETDLEMVKKVKSQFKKRKSFKQEFLIYTKDGDKKWFEIDVSPVFDKAKGKQKFIGIQEDITKRKQLEKEREEAVANLRERVKEQVCLYNITALDEQSIEDLLKKAISFIPSGWQYPDIAAVSIEFEDQVFRSNNYRDTEWKLTAERKCLNGSELKIQVVYLEHIPGPDGSLFIKEEGQLIDSMANHLMLKINQLLSRQELQEKERRLEKMGRMSRIGNWEIDLDNDSVYWSAMMKQIFEVADDFSPDLEMAYSFYKAGEDRERIAQVVNDAITKGKSFDVEMRIITANGKELWTRAIGDPKMNKEGICVRLDGSFQDIDKHKRTEIESEQRRLLLEAISDKAEAAIWVRDSEGRHVFVNQEWKNIFDLSDQQIIGKTALEILDKATAKAFQKNDSKVLASDQSIKYEERIPTLRGDRYYLTNMFPMGEIPGVGKSIGGIASDITERKQVEEELKFNSILLDEIGESVISTDPEGKIIYWNNAAEQLYGWSQSEVLGQNIIDITPSKVSKEQAAEIFSLLVNGESWTGEFEVERKDGTEFCAVVTNSPVYNEEGKLIAIIGISSDMTERKANEQELKNSLKEKELLLGEVHHRVKNNLAIISSLITLQMMEVEDENFKMILENSNNRIHSIAMVHELLYRSESFTEIPFEKYIKDLLLTIKRTIGSERKNIDLVTKVEIGGLSINQAIPLGLMLNELITNSLKYAFIDKKKGKIKVTITRLGDYIKVLYEDNGKGYPDDIDFAETGSFGHTLIHALLKQLSEEYKVETKGKFRLEFQFKERKRGAHSNFSG